MATVPVNPDILRWARETAGMTLDEAAIKLQLRQARGILPAERLELLERGIAHPTRPLLLKMCKHYRRPLLAFYMEAPPPKGDRGEDFRRLPEDYTETDDALVDTLIRDVRTRQSIVRAVIEDEDEAVPIPFIGSATMDDGVEHICASIRDSLEFDLKVFREQRNVTEAFAYLRNQTEAAGVFVLIIGDLGSHHTTISAEIFRGFSLADDVAPFVVVNNQDARAAWSFTLLHELAHLWLGQTGISGAIVGNRTEQFCNDVAGSLLLPIEELDALSISDHTDLEVDIDEICNFASARNVSRAMVAYKLYRATKINFDRWNTLRIRFRRQWYEHREEKRKQFRKKAGGPDYYVVRRQRVGPALIGLISRMVSSGALTSTKAGKVLGVKPQNVFELVRQGR